MALKTQTRNILGRIWECEQRIARLEAQRVELLDGISAACLAGNIEKAYDCAEATTRIDQQLRKAEADLELWESVR